MGGRPKEDSVGAVQLLALADEVGKSCGEGITMLASVGSSGYKRPPLALEVCQGSNDCQI